MRKQATIRDVAQLAGVSLATVSRVLSDSTYPVSAELRQKVKSAVEELQYVSNACPKSPRTETVRDVGLVIPNITNQFYIQTILGINDVLALNNQNLVLCNTMRSTTEERKSLRQLYDRGVKGVILSSVDENADIVNEFSQKGMKFVLLDQILPNGENTGINFDAKNGAELAADHLLKLGHRKIAFASLPMTRWTRMEIYQGYRNALAEAGIPFDKKLVYEYMPAEVSAFSDMELEAGNQIAKAFLLDGCPATAIMCINDMLAIGIIRTLIENDVKVPEDVSVFGFDDIPFASTFIPQLTTIHCPAVEMGRVAAMMLLDALRNENSDMTVSMRLSPSLVVRDTVAPPKDRNNLT